MERYARCGAELDIEAAEDPRLGYVGLGFARAPCVEAVIVPTGDTVEQSPLRAPGIGVSLGFDLLTTPRGHLGAAPREFEQGGTLLEMQRSTCCGGKGEKRSQDRAKQGGICSPPCRAGMASA